MKRTNILAGIENSVGRAVLAWPLPLWQKALVPWDL
jgi:hypothetical protein